jgi:hypothetical protein
VRGFEVGQIGDCVQMYIVHPLIDQDYETVVYIDFLNSSFCCLCCTALLVVKILR